MAVAIGAGVSYGTARMKITDHFGKFVIKSFQFDGAMLDDVTDDTPLQQIMEDFDALTNGLVTNAFVAGHEVTGLKGAALNAIFPRVADEMVLTFSQTNPINAAKTIFKTFLIPAPVAAIVNTDESPIVGTSGEGSAPARLARLIGNLEDALIYIAADGSINVGGWGYLQADSGMAD